MRFIATGDWHLRSDIPRSVKVEKTEDWIGLQIKNLRQIFDIANEEKIDTIIVAGDIFNTYQENQSLINSVLAELAFWKEKGISILAIAGNHDLPYHSFQNLNNSSFGILANAGAINLLDNCGGIHDNFGNSETKYSFIGRSFGCEDYMRKVKTNLGILHRLVAPKDTFPADVKIDDPESVFAEFPDIENLIVGDYHHAFIAHKFPKAGKTAKGKKGKLLVPGCIGRQAIDMETYECKVWYCVLEKNDFRMESKPLKPLWDLERVEGAVARKGLVEAFASFSMTAFDYRDRIKAEENLQHLTEPQKDLIHEIIHRSA